MTEAKKRKYFGTDGIRGKANNGKLNALMVTKIGMAAGLSFHRGGFRPHVLIGKDTRVSGYMIEAALQSGFTSVGMDVQLTGPIPTPGVAMLTPSMRADLGVMISASHNSYEDNGIKFFGPDGYKLSDEKELEIEELIESDLTTRLAESADFGRARRIDEAQGRYIEHTKRSLPKAMELNGLRVVIDCANGAAYKVAPQVLKELGADVFGVGVDPDGFNINDECGSTDPASMVREVYERRADIGIALDGDADRVVLCDEKGRIINGDQLLAAVAKSWHEDGRLAAPVVVGTVMSNFGLERMLRGMGIELVRASVGDRYVLEQMRAHESNLGGEQSGHIIMSDYATTGDGLMAALQVLALVKKLGRPVSEVMHLFEPVPQVLKSARYKNGDPLEIPSVKQAIEEGERALGENGRVVVRLSGTEPVIRVMAEGEDKRSVEGVVDSIIAAVEGR